MQRAVHVLRRERQRGDARAGRVVDRVRHRRGDADRRRFAHALRTLRPFPVHGLDEADVHLRDFGRRDQLVVAEVRVADHARLDPQVFGDGVALPHDDAALDLALDAQPVEHAPDVVRAGHLEQAHDAGLRVQLDFAYLRRPGVGGRDVALELLVLVVAGRLVIETGHDQFGAVGKMQPAQELGELIEFFPLYALNDEPILE